MKHWDGRDRDDASSLRLPQRDRQRIRELFLDPPSRQRRSEPPHIGSVIGLALAIGVLVGLALLLAPSEPVSTRLLR